MTRAPVVDATHTLLAMLTYKRPADSKSERAFIRQYILPLGVTVDAFGNLYKRIGTAPVLWSSHTDTVHHKGGRQNVRMTEGIATSDADCLGADCTVGVFLMTEMIKAGIEGLYIFHRCEEIGGLGSSYIADETPNLLSGIKYAIAFDRRANHSVITHQAGGRCCSEAFAASLSSALGLGHRPDSGGSFTDTANYIGLVSECTNLSVGYLNEHTAKERLDVDYLLRLRAALLKMDLAALVSERIPGTDAADWYDDKAGNVLWLDDDQTPRRGADDLLNLVRDNPHIIADWIEEYGVDADEIADIVLERGGIVRRR